MLHAVTGAGIKGRAENRAVLLPPAELNPRRKGRESMPPAAAATGSADSDSTVMV